MMSKKHGEAGKRASLMLAVIVATVIVSSGVALAATVINCGSFEQDPLTPECDGTRNADTLEGTATKNYIYGRGGGDTLKGFDENDQLFGQGGSDRLLGGSGVDSLYGGTGKDTLRGGTDIDMYYFDAGWGKDTITDGTGPGNKVDVLSTDYEYVIVRLTSSPGPEMKNSARTSTVNWDDNVIDAVYDGGGDDKITGNGLPNHIMSMAPEQTRSPPEGATTIFTPRTRAWTTWTVVKTSSVARITTQSSTLLQRSVDQLRE